MHSPDTLVPRADAGLAARLARSALAVHEGHWTRTADVEPWLRERSQAHRFHVRRVPFEDLDGWSFDGVTGNLGHRSGRFFTIEGLRITGGPGGPGVQDQPIINQPEIGILGILAKEFDGVLHFLMQAKVEPGNPEAVQLSPTVQATRSNYTRTHGGSPVKYLDYFTRPEYGRALVDVLQSEHGEWFYRKSNRNVIVEAAGHVDTDSDFCWLTLGQIGELLRRDLLVNMDTRSVLACAPVPRSEPGARHSDVALQSWLSMRRAVSDMRAALVPLAGLRGWQRTPASFEPTAEGGFRVVAVQVEAANREVGGWSQPLVEPKDQGLAAFLLRRFDGVPHLLAHARTEGGLTDAVELAPTVQGVPADAAADGRPPFLDEVLAAAPERTLFDARHSEEGGRFLNAVSRYAVIEADPEAAPRTPPPGFIWVTPGQLSDLVRGGRNVNVQARTLISALNTGAAAL
ncbi:NDP-hexose 2,3-dehydratase family protein [Streptomyces anulatus]|uniref:NDP-hexose 2,3-dehydratase family protein n=1 Tax=Streptomyces anulatus TaxID=1892 RepID=UPI002E36CE9C|nr:NDP-hexose 2,3-dehydratase family protein [Streptomyces anulatus]WTD29325.1 NDP-hexose 2,3-dehydratase family protein [Streptomyces anulatus]